VQEREEEKKLGRFSEADWR